MDNAYEIVPVEKPDESFWEVVGRGIHHFNVQMAGDLQSQQVCLALRAADGKIAGGLIGKTYWNWFYIDLLFIQEGLRGQGYGHRLLTLAEAEARQRGATEVFLDTFSFQAPEFYQRHGYQVFGVLKDFPPGQARYYLTRHL